jgi:hypothetical protein
MLVSRVVIEEVCQIYACHRCTILTTEKPMMPDAASAATLWEEESGIITEVM